METDKKHLENLSLHVHNALRMLKVGQSATITCGKEYNQEETLQYIQAYAMHKRKWFESKYDATSKVIYSTRVAVPSWTGPEKEEEPDEP